METWLAKEIIIFKYIVKRNTKYKEIKYSGGWINKERESKAGIRRFTDLVIIPKVVKT